MQPRENGQAGVPSKGRGSPGAGMSGLLHEPTSAMRSATVRHSSGCQPSAAAPTVPSHQQEHERRQLRQPERLDDRAVRVDEREELVGQRAEELPGAVVVGGHQPPHPDVGAAEPSSTRAAAASTHELWLV